MGFGKADPNALAGVAFLNAALRLCGGNDEVSVDDWTNVIKNSAGSTPNEVALQVLSNLGTKCGPAGMKVGQALDGKVPKAGASGAAAGGGQGIAARNKAIYQQAGAEPLVPPAGPPGPGHGAPQKAAPAAAAAKKSGIADARAAFTGGDAIAPPAAGPPGGAPKSPGQPAQAAAAGPGKLAARKAFEGGAAAPAAAGGGGGAKASGSWTGPGLFLVYEVTQNGSLFLVYSKTAVPNAIAYGKPSKTIPDFKFSTLSGRSELKRGASDAKAYMQGVAAFIKAGKAHGCGIDINETGGPFEVQAYIRYANDRVVKCEPGQSTPTDDLDAVACIPRANADLQGIKTMARGIFVQRADAHGGSAS